jgi:hypothetical protein
MIAMRMKLARPIQVDGREVAELAFRDPAEIGPRQFNEIAKYAGAAAAVRLIALLADIPLAAIDDLGGRDLTVAIDTANRLVAGQRTCFRIGDTVS